MKALVLKSYGRLSYEDVPEPEVGPDDVLVAVKACGICGSDVHGMDGSTGRRIPPVIMGHEAAGVIAQVGPGVGDFRPGERVTFDSTVYCGRCTYCRRGQVNLCDDRRVLGVSCADYRRDGALAQYVAVPRRTLYRLPAGVSFEQASVVEPLSVALHAVRRAPLRPGDTAVVVGAGVIGLLVVQCLKAAGCGGVIAVDPLPERLEVARRLGADEAISPARVHAATAGVGAALAFEAVGVTQALQTAIACLRKGGSLTLIGNVSPAVELPLQTVVTREISLAGSCASAGEYPDCLDMIARGVVDVDALTSAVAPLAEGAQWFGRLAKGAPGLLKVILVP
jgi:L-iditol 2-dehydrogenase